VNIELSAKLEILHSNFRGHKLEFGGDDKGESFTSLLGGQKLLKLIDSGYASRYLNMSNTYMGTRLYTQNRA